MPKKIREGLNLESGSEVSFILKGGRQIDCTHHKLRKAGNDTCG
ncbi:MAG: AbrB/MazE/SpoVT family DNA-binding domain-containing protein [Candidatus Nanohalobium sp.]